MAPNTAASQQPLGPRRDSKLASRRFDPFDSHAKRRQARVGDEEISRFGAAEGTGAGPFALAPNTPRAAARLRDLLVASAESRDHVQLVATIDAALLVYPAARALELVVNPSLRRLVGPAREAAIGATRHCLQPDCDPPL